MRYKSCILALVLLSTFSGCAEIGSALKEVNGDLATTNNALSGIKEQNVSRVVKPLPNKIATENMKEAMPTINKTLSIIACAPKNAYGNLSYQNRVMRYATSDSFNQNIFLPGAVMANHRTGCLDIERIDNYQQVAKNAFMFNALYVSPQSGESKNIQYKMIKEPSGEWLFKF